MKITAQDLLRFGVIDTLIPEPLGGAHRDPAATVASAGKAISTALAGFAGMGRDAIRKQRRDKFLAIGRTMI
jgi:acetyl-CoA carboxylase carboxyl transferase subunit alpha